MGAKGSPHILYLDDLWVEMESVLDMSAHIPWDGQTSGAQLMLWVEARQSLSTSTEVRAVSFVTPPSCIILPYMGKPN